MTAWPHADCQPEPRTMKANTKTPETNSTSWNTRHAAGGSIFLVVLIPASPVHPFAQLLPENLKGVLIILDSLIMLNNKQTKVCVCV